MMFDDGEQKKLKLRFKGLLISCLFTRKGEHLWLDYNYNADLTKEFKTIFAGMTWHGYKTPPIKKWSIAYDDHNLFQIRHLSGLKPYQYYDDTIKTIESNAYSLETTRPLKQHQKDLTHHIIKVKRGIWAAEMGLGKSLAAIEAFEQIKPNKVFWISINSALLSVRLEYSKWKATVPVNFMTYDSLKKYLKEQVIPINDWIPPQFIMLDESQNVKTSTTQRTQAAIYLVNRAAEFWGDDLYVLLMTGTPAPKSPIDWYSQCEIACPGFLKEGSIYAFKDRLAIIEKKENTVTGGIYPELLAWRDSEDKCDICGKLKDDDCHPKDAFDQQVSKSKNKHIFAASINEVEGLYKRMKGLVVVKTKKDCLTLPDKIYEKRYCKPSVMITNVMKSILQRSDSVIKGLMLCRELSDGFQYTQEETGTQTCEVCIGTKTYRQQTYCGPIKTKEFIEEIGLSEELKLTPSGPEDVIIDVVKYPQYFEVSETICPGCNGKGVTPTYSRAVKDMKTSKDKALEDILEEYDDYGRLVVYCGFTASVDKCVEIIGAKGWQVIRVDGRGWDSSINGDKKHTALELIDAFQTRQSDYPKLALVGHPGSSSTGLTLTASNVIVYYSNTFNAEDRQQSEDRIHRLGMDENRGAKIIDLIHLPTDQYVLDNLLKKKKLQEMSTGQLLKAVNEYAPERVDYE